MYPLAVLVSGAAHAGSGRHAGSRLSRGYPALSFLAETIQPDDLSAFAGLTRLVLVFRRGGGDRQAGGSRDGREFCPQCFVGGVRRLELQAELHGRIEETFDRVEWNDQPL